MSSVGRSPPQFPDEVNKSSTIYIPKVTESIKSPSVTIGLVTAGGTETPVHFSGLLFPILGFRTFAQISQLLGVLIPLLPAELSSEKAEMIFGYG